MNLRVRERSVDLNLVMKEARRELDILIVESLRVERVGRVWSCRREVKRHQGPGLRSSDKDRYFSPFALFSIDMRDVMESFESITTVNFCE